MQLITITGRDTEASRQTLADLGLARWLAAAADGDINACFDLGVAFSTGRSFTPDKIHLSLAGYGVCQTIRHMTIRDYNPFPKSLPR